MSISATWWCFWSLFCFESDCFSEEFSTEWAQSRAVMLGAISKGLRGCFSPSVSSSGCTGIGFGFLGGLKHGLHPTPTYVAGYSSFKIDKQVFPASHGVNVRKGSRQYDILQKWNTVQFNNSECQNVMTILISRECTICSQIQKSFGATWSNSVVMSVTFALLT